MNTRRPAVFAVIADLGCLAVFVAAGRQSHDIGGGAGWYLGVLWPLVVGWFGVALLDQLYARRTSWALRYGLTLVVGVGAGLLLRAVVTHRSTPVAFVLVSYAFIAALTLGWRLVALGVQRLQARRHPDASSA